MIKKIGTYHGILSHYQTDVFWNSESMEITGKFPAWSKPSVIGKAPTSALAIEKAKEILQKNFKEAENDT